jgi:GNAT superfamily N-acetyltransferase
LALAAKAHWGYSARTLESWRADLAISAETLARPCGVACLEDAVAGFYTLQPASPAWELDNLWVDPACMGRGVGRALLAHALDAAQRAGAVRVVVDSDPNAEAFYRACGAHRTGTQPAPIAGDSGRVRPQLAFDLSGKR